METTGAGERDALGPEQVGQGGPGQDGPGQNQARKLPPPFSRPGELDLFALLMLQRRHLLRTIAFGLIGLGLSAWYTLTATPRFSSTATLIIPAKVPNGASSALSQLGALDLLGGGYAVYVDILSSRTVQDDLIERFNLKDHFGSKDLTVAERSLAAETAIAVKTEGLLTITVTDRDPVLAAQLANAYSLALEGLNAHLAVTAAGQQRAFFQEQMVEEKNALADAEAKLAGLQVRTGIVVAPETQASQDTSALEGVRSQLRAKQVQRAALLQGETEQNPEVKRLDAEISGLQGQLGALQNGNQTTATGTTLATLPEQNMALARAKREVTFHEGLFSSLATEYESAKEQEARDISVLEVLDPAVPAKIKSWPPRVKFGMYSLLAGLAFGIVFTLLEALVRAVLRNDANRARMRALAWPPRGSRA